MCLICFVCNVMIRERRVLKSRGLSESFQEAKLGELMYCMLWMVFSCAGCRITSSCLNVEMYNIYNVSGIYNMDAYYVVHVAFVSDFRFDFASRNALTYRNMPHFGTLCIWFGGGEERW